MAEKKEIELFISEEGEVRLHIKGVKGASCLKTLEAISKSCGQLKDKQLTGEYYEQAKTQGKQSTNNTL